MAVYFYARKEAVDIRKLKKYKSTDVYKRQLLLRADGYETDFYKKD